VPLVAGGIDGNESAPVALEISVGDVAGGALIAILLEAVGRLGEVERIAPGAPDDAPRPGFREPIPEDRP